jgi:hypothetical protein
VDGTARAAWVAGGPLSRVAVAQNAIPALYNFRLKIMHMLWAIAAAFGALHCGSRARDAKVGRGWGGGVGNQRECRE